MDLVKIEESDEEFEADLFKAINNLLQEQVIIITLRQLPAS